MSIDYAFKVRNRTIFNRFHDRIFEAQTNAVLLFPAFVL